MQPHQRLQDVLVVTSRKSFWMSRECEIFPNILYTWRVYGHSTNRANSLLLFIRAVIWILFKRPRLVFIGSAIRLGIWLAWIKNKCGLKFRLIVTNRFFPDFLASQVDRCIVYEKKEISLYGDSEKYVFTPLPPDGNFNRECFPKEPPYIFSGGSAGRDFSVLIEAVKDLPVELLIVTHSQKKLGYNLPLPQNCRVEYRISLDDYLDRIAKSLLVVVPLKDGNSPRGQTTVLQGMSLGKCVISSDIPANWDYITHNLNGILVPPENSDHLRSAVNDLLGDSEKRKKIALEAKKSSLDWTYAGFRDCIVNLCITVLNEDRAYHETK